jgi:hypothetical protein
MICNIFSEIIFCILSAEDSEKTDHCQKCSMLKEEGLFVNLDEKAVDDGGRLHAGPVLLLLPLLALGHGGVAGH